MEVFLANEGITRMFTLNESLSMIQSHASQNHITSSVLFANNPVAQIICRHFGTLLSFLRYVRTPISLREMQVQRDTRAVMIARASALRSQRFLLMEDMKEGIIHDKDRAIEISNQFLEGLYKPPTNNIS